MDSKVPKRDVATCSNYEEVKISHLTFDLNVDFDTTSIHGKVTYNCEFLDNNTSSIILDIADISVKNVAIWLPKEVDPFNLPFQITSFSSFGDRLEIDLSEHISLLMGDKFTFFLEYDASEGGGLCWLSPSQTCGKLHPYLYTQGQAVLNRSFFPCQDTPSVRCTFDACVTVPEGFTALMSANLLSPNEGERCPVLGEDFDEGGEATYDDTKRCFRFDMPHTIPPYLIAMAVGHIKGRRMSERCTVWSEEEQLDDAHFEFSELTEQYLTAGEELFGPYLWTKYDILVLPPSFPFGFIKRIEIFYQDINGFEAFCLI